MYPCLLKLVVLAISVAPVAVVTFIGSSTCPAQCSLEARVLRCLHLPTRDVNHLLECLRLHDYVIVLDVVNSRMKCSCSYLDLAMRAFQKEKVVFGPYPCSLPKDLDQKCNETLMPAETFVFMGKRFALNKSAWEDRIKAHVDWVVKSLESLPDKHIREEYNQALLVELRDTALSIQGLREDAKRVSTQTGTPASRDNAKEGSRTPERGSVASALPHPDSGLPLKLHSRPPTQNAPPHRTENSTNLNWRNIFKIAPDGGYSRILSVESSERLPSELSKTNSSQRTNSSSLKWHSSAKLKKLLREALEKMQMQAYNRRMEIVLFGCLAAVFIAILVAFLVAKLDAQRKESLMELRQGRQDAESASYKRRLTLWESFLAKLQIHSKQKMDGQRQVRKDDFPASTHLLQRASDLGPDRRYGTQSEVTSGRERSQTEPNIDLTLMNLKSHSLKDVSEAGPSHDRNESSLAGKDQTRSDPLCYGVSSKREGEDNSKQNVGKEKKKDSFFEEMARKRGYQLERTKEGRLLVFREKPVSARRPGSPSLNNSAQTEKPNSVQSQKLETLEGRCATDNENQTRSGQTEETVSREKGKSTCTGQEPANSSNNAHGKDTRTDDSRVSTDASSFGMNDVEIISFGNESEDSCDETGIAMNVDFTSKGGKTAQDVLKAMKFSVGQLYEKGLIRGIPVKIRRSNPHDSQKKSDESIQNHLSNAKCSTKEATTSPIQFCRADFSHGRSHSMTPKPNPCDYRRIQYPELGYEDERKNIKKEIRARLDSLPKPRRSGDDTPRHHGDPIARQRSKRKEESADDASFRMVHGYDRWPGEMRAQREMSRPHRAEDSRRLLSWHGVPVDLLDEPVFGPKKSKQLQRYAYGTDGTQEVLSYTKRQHGLKARTSSMPVASYGYFGKLSKPAHKRQDT